MHHIGKVKHRSKDHFTLHKKLWTCGVYPRFIRTTHPHKQTFLGAKNQRNNPPIHLQKKAHPGDPYTWQCPVGPSDHNLTQADVWPFWLGGWLPHYAEFFSFLGIAGLRFFTLARNPLDIDGLGAQIVVHHLAEVHVCAFLCRRHSRTGRDPFVDKQCIPVLC